jgi:hypothetical protein
MEKKSSNLKIDHGEKITRKDAFKKAGKYAAFTAASMMLILSPVETSAKKKSRPPRPRG